MTTDQHWDLPRIITTMQVLRVDCEHDARKLDATPFTAQGVGETLGGMLAQIAALAKAVESLAREVSR